jgi:hypothetical protein
MLTDSGYQLALLAYAVAALVALPLAARWLLPRAGIGLRLVIVLPLAALLLTPAYIQPGADTLAPALVVALFQFMGEGAAGAQHALRPLGLLSAAALLLGMKFEGTERYVATEDLSMAVNAAVTLQRPLLIKGEPGTGKTDARRGGGAGPGHAAHPVAHQVDDEGAAGALRVRRRVAAARFAAR